MTERQSKPTKEQIEEAEKLAEKYFVMDFNTPTWVFGRVGLASFVTHIRTQENNDALERAAFMCNCVANDYAVEDDHLPPAMMRLASNQRKVNHE